MSLREKLQEQNASNSHTHIFARFGITSNPFPSSNQTANNPHLRLPVEEEVDARIVSFLRDAKSQVVVLEGTQGVGKTNLLGFYETEIRDVLRGQDQYYVVRYLADPEASFEGIIRRLFQELGVEHLERLAQKLKEQPAALSAVRNSDMRAALTSIMKDDDAPAKATLMMEWLLGFRLLKAHREALNVQFRLDTVELKTASFRDLVHVSSAAGMLKGIFLLLDELEKQDGVLGPTAVVRYLSAMRAIIDALPKHLFMMIAVTPDAMRRYSAALPAFRSRLQNQIILSPLSSLEEASALAKFYINEARDAAKGSNGIDKSGTEELLSDKQIAASYLALQSGAERRGDTGVRHRDFLHALHMVVEDRIQAAA